MSIFRRHNPNQLIPLHPDNTRNADWVILLEANTIADDSGERLRVARTTQARSVVKRFWPFKRRVYLHLEGYDPRIHFVVFCPQLYKHDRIGRLVPMRGSEIGRFIARALDHKAAPRNPWYSTSAAVPNEPIIRDAMLNEYDTLLAEPDFGPPIAPAGIEHTQTKRLEAPDRFAP